MKITIDTQKDSKEDIKRAISFLSEFINSSFDNLNQNNNYTNDNYNEDKEEVQPMMNMFGTSEDSTISQDSTKNSVKDKLAENERSEESEDSFDETAKLIPY